jgi:hypothetical protein
MRCDLAPSVLDDPAAELGVGRQDAAVDDEVLVRLGNQRGQAFEKGRGSEEELGRAVVVGALERKDYATVLL